MCSKVGRDPRAVSPVAAVGAQARGTAGVRDAHPEAIRARCIYSCDVTALLCFAKKSRVGPAALTLAIMASFCFIQSCLPSEPVTSRVARGESICRSCRECARHLSEASSPSNALATSQSVSTSGVAPSPATSYKESYLHSDCDIMSDPSMLLSAMATCSGAAGIRFRLSYFRLAEPLCISLARPLRLAWTVALGQRLSSLHPVQQ